MTEKYVCVGDVHGRYDLLTRVLARKDAEYPDHRLIFLGDYIDRGDESFEVLETVKKRVEEGAVAVLGNHEDFMLQYVAHGMQDKSNVWFLPGNGGNKTIQSYQRAGKDYSHNAIFRVPNKAGHLTFLKSLPTYFETDTIFASHAPIHKDTLDSKGRHSLIWSYFEDEENAKDWGKLSICGHIHALRRDILTPRLYPHIIYADTGCGCAPWGPLSAVIIEDGKYVTYFQEAPIAAY